jgi:hypothetical protein
MSKCHVLKACYSWFEKQKQRLFSLNKKILQCSYAKKNTHELSNYDHFMGIGE